MKYITIVIFLLCSMTVFSQKIELSKTSSSLKWTGKAAFDAYSLSGTLQSKSGTLTIENNKIKSGEIIINMKSLNASNKDLQKHLRGKDFFEVKKHKIASFTLTEAVDLQAKKVIAKGKLTVKGITKEYSFALRVKKIGEKYQVNGTLEIDRTDFGIYYNSPNYFEGLKQQAIADKFMLEMQLLFE